MVLEDDGGLQPVDEDNVQLKVGPGGAEVVAGAQQSLHAEQKAQEDVKVLLAGQTSESVAGEGLLVLTPRELK